MRLIENRWWGSLRCLFIFHTVSNTDIYRMMEELASGNVCCGNSLNVGQKENKKPRVTYRTSTLLPQLTPIDFVWDEMI